MVKRILLFLVTLVLIILNIFIMINLLGLHSYILSIGISDPLFILVCVLWGIAGSLLGLMTCKTHAETEVKIKYIHSSRSSPIEQELITLIHDLAREKNLSISPQVGIYQSPELNAFAIGPNKNKTMIAVSSGLLLNMKGPEESALLDHVVTSIANNDLITLILLQSLVSSFSTFFARLVFNVVSFFTTQRGKSLDSNISTLTYSLITFIFDILLTLLGSLVVRAFSRQRIFRADRGGAQLAGYKHMIAALEQLRSASELEDDRAGRLSIFKIAHRPGCLALFSIHPSLLKRINYLAHHANAT